MKKEEIRKELLANVDEEYKKFNEKLTPTRYEVLGVRLPILRDVAKNMAKNFEESLQNTDFMYFEEVFLFGLTSCYIKADAKTKLSYFDKYLNYADNWSHIDSVVMTIGFKKSELDIVKQKAEEYILSGKEFVERAGVLLIMKHFLDNELNECVKLLEKAETKYYYVSMAVAWCLCELAITNPKFLIEYLQNAPIDDKTVNRAISKCRDSFRISDENKKKLKELKRYPLKDIPD